MNITAETQGNAMSDYKIAVYELEIANEYPPDVTGDWSEYAGYAGYVFH